MRKPDGPSERCGRITAANTGRSTGSVGGADASPSSVGLVEAGPVREADALPSLMLAI
jgi:hypothetical protein